MKRIHDKVKIKKKNRNETVWKQTECYKLCKKTKIKIKI